MTVLLNPRNIRGHKLLLSVEVSEGWMKKKTCSNIFHASCVSIFEDFGQEKVSLGLQHFAKDKWGFHDALFISFKHTQSDQINNK